jgi:hypothetical protein
VEGGLRLWRSQVTSDGEKKVKVPPYLIPRAHSVIPGATLANQTLINATHDPVVERSLAAGPLAA